jgi:hypothetical protein
MNFEKDLYVFKDDEYDNNFLKNYNVYFNYKTIYLPLIFLPTLNFFEIFRNEIFLFTSIFTSLFILTWNIPSFSKSFYMRPIYYEDLYNEKMDITKEDLSKKKILYNIELSKKFKDKFLVIQQFILSLTLAIIIEYFSLKYNQKEYSLSEILGMIGGILSLYLKLINIIGKSTLSILYKMKVKEKKKLLDKLNITQNMPNQFLDLN